ncbi:hypothetical protein D0469_09090 [Peribacillus saganii]|uniref:protein acetyllysine N-acetyltransferase n=1 Tax=Peribacillus saganii TaxID=2303992 RepID=A0A372LR40_9BACI|nr:Sir2 family NAD-dependent protein deacetylase [Peribacillus saganii]RFU69510.1 hypothetical protein D0469_09090 [Peribacillus saganii]
MPRYETRKIVFSKNDLPKDIKAGDVRKYFSSQIRIKDLHHTNQYGNFILCDYIFDAEEKERVDAPWDIKKGVLVNENNPYELLHVLTVRSVYQMPTTVGYMVKNRNNGEIMGLSYKQTWNLLYHEGATNAEATISRYGKFTTHLLDTIDELPSLSSSYWQLSPIDENEKLLVPLTKEVMKELEKSLKRVINEGLKKRIRRLSAEQSNKDYEAMDLVAERIRTANKITVLTGAGISTMSGIPDYRSAAAGVWQQKPDLLRSLNQQTFLEDPKQFWDSYYDLFAVTLNEIIPYQTNEAVVTAIDMINPNEGHQFFAKLEETGKNVTILTQNVDGLHQKAGSRNVLEIHGNVTTCSCLECGRTYRLKEVFKVGSIPRCECGHVLRPNVVFFGDAVQQFDRGEEAIVNSDLIIVAGTSLQVSPFNQLPRLAAANDIPVVYINGEAPDDEFDYVLQGNISEICGILEQKQ